MGWFDKIKSYYESGLWNIEWVKNAVVMGKITTIEFEAITGQIYIA